MPGIHKILIANRGEIALRIIRTAREMDIATVAVYSDVDRNARHVSLADEAYLLGTAAPSQSYLNVEKLLEIATRSGADAVHPGYGFLAENAAFARTVTTAGLTWIGPHPAAIDAMGDKIRARQAMIAAGVPVVPGDVQALRSLEDVQRAAETYGLPLVLKASGGGGGKGLKVARSFAELESAFTTACREAQAYFGNATVYAERYLENPKHVELQILADHHGNVLHVGERDCSLQRRRQKLWEESPPAISPEVRQALRKSGLAAARSVGYDSVGTIEFLVEGSSFFFLEMNTRIQVEHTVTEMVYGLDLIREQIRIAAGEALGYGQERLNSSGHAIEVRLNAEDPAQNFAPSPGTITRFEPPAGLGVRVDSAAFSGYAVVPDYDSLIAKLIVWAPTRTQARARLRRAIDEFAIEGIATTACFLRALCDHPPVADETYGTATLEAFAQTYAPSEALACAPGVPYFQAPASDEVIRVEVNGRLYEVRLLDLPGAPHLAPAGKRMGTAPRPRWAHGANASSNDITAPLHGMVLELSAAPGMEVKAGQVLLIIEAMKMMNELRAPRDGTVASVHVEKGKTVERGKALVRLEPLQPASLSTNIASPNE